MIRSVVIIGSGNLAEALARAVAASPLGLRQVFGRNRDRVAAVAALSGTVGESDPSRLARADIYLIAVSDAAVAEVASSLPIDAAAGVAHTAGSVPGDALARFPRRAVFYPFQTFTKGREADFSEIPILVETASPDLRGEVEAFARCLSRTVLYADSALRGQVHLAGVFACNFANHLFELGGEVLRRAGVSADLLRPLIAETTAKALAAAIKGHDSLWESGTLSYDMSQYEIARTYFQWLCDHCRYDNAAADDSASHLAYGALVSGLAVCDGYTGAYNLLLKLEGIECTSLFNDSHIWTLAELDGTTYHIDVTWGDQYGRTDLRYFGMSEEQSYRCHPWGTAGKKK